MKEINRRKFTTQLFVGTGALVLTPSLEILETIREWLARKGIWKYRLKGASGFKPASKLRQLHGMDAEELLVKDLTEEIERELV